jgi:hypothetical protein
VRPSRPAEFCYGDQVRVTGQFIAPPEFPTFNYADFLARQGMDAFVGLAQALVSITRELEESIFSSPFHELYTRTCLPRQYAESSSSPAAASR